MQVDQLLVLQCICLAALLLSYGVLGIHVLSWLYWLWLQRRTRRLPPLSPTNTPRVAIIKPLKGSCRALQQNLESYFLQDYPEFELHFCIATPDDEARSTVEALMKRFANVKARLHTSETPLGHNPKINNIYAAYESTTCDFVWISDANLEALPHTLSTMVREHFAMGPDRVGAVHQLPTVVADARFGTIVEQVYFATQHAFVYIYADLSLDCCVNGMSLLLRKSVVAQRAGGLAPYANYLAEDFFLTRVLYDSGLRHCLSAVPARQRLQHSTLSEVIARHLRWFRLRRGSLPILSLLEPLSESVPLAVLCSFSAWLLSDGRIAPWLYAAAHLTVWALIDGTMWRTLHPSSTAPLYRAALAWLLREAGSLGMYIAGLRTRLVNWRGRDFIIGPDGKAVPVADGNKSKTA